MAGKLKLRAEDEEDLAVVSAFLQDALLPVGEMAFLAEDHRFVLVAHRFKWEQEQQDGKDRFQRTLTGIAFDGVNAVQVRGFEAAQRDRILQILAVRATPGAVVVEFSGADALRLEVGGIMCHLEDLGEPWPTPWRPPHPLDNG